MVIVLALVGCLAVGSLAILNASAPHGTMTAARLVPEKPRPAPVILRTPTPPPALRGPVASGSTFQLRTARL
jgi:hypothetical protein